MTERGAVLPVALFLTIACVFLAALLTDIAAVNLERQRAQTACDFSLLSAMRIRREGIESIATRWAAFGGDISIVGGALVVDPMRWTSVSTAADALRRSLSGFQGRVTSALTVALDANELPRSASRTLSGTGLRLGISAQTSPVMVGASIGSLPGAWYLRGWAASDSAPRLSDDARLSIEWPLPWRGGSATLRVESVARLEWDADLDDPSVLLTGHGGFVRSISEATNGARFTPHRFPVFRAAREREI